MEGLDLKKVPTRELALELEQRTTVESLSINVGHFYHVKTQDVSLKRNGPTLILLVDDNPFSK